MAEIAPFRGVLYDPRRVDPSRVLAPPYDVISEEERQALEAADEHNCVRLILPRGEGDARYAAAADHLHRWMADGTLARDPQPALYRYHQLYPVEGREVVRRGFVSLVRLARFEERIVRPHERTLAGPKADRLKLMRATCAHLSQVFALYSDPARETDAAFAAAEAAPPTLEGRTAGDGVRHRLWRVEDPTTIRRVAALMAPRPLYIADGHHRYETMIALRDELLAGAPSASARSAARYGTLFLANADDPGLLVFPTHRLVHGLPRFELAGLLAQARAAFEVQSFVGAPTAAGLRADLERAGARAPSLAVVAPEGWALLTLRRDVAPAAVGLDGPTALRELDVTVLHDLVLERILGIDREAQARQTHLRYVKDAAAALAAVERREAQVAFLMNPTRIGQVLAAADAGEVMPQKSTFFFPKIASGLAMNVIDPLEEISAP